MEFVFMLTDNDRTVPRALQALDAVAETGLRHIGFKDAGASPALQKHLADRAHEAGLSVHLEVVSTSRAEELASIESGVAAGVDYILGGTSVAEGAEILDGTGIRYLPFAGRVVGHPTQLKGTVDEIARHVGELAARPGVHGVDLLAYRNPDVDHASLIAAAVTAVDGPVLVAGSVESAGQIREIADAGAWGFTIGGAIFGGRLPGGASVTAQVATALALARSHLV